MAAVWNAEWHLSCELVKSNRIHNLIWLKFIEWAMVLMCMWVKCVIASLYNSWRCENLIADKMLRSFSETIVDTQTRTVEMKLDIPKQYAYCLVYVNDFWFDTNERIVYSNWKLLCMWCAWDSVKRTRIDWPCTAMNSNRFEFMLSQVSMYRIWDKTSEIRYMAHWKWVSEWEKESSGNSIKTYISFKT